MTRRTPILLTLLLLIAGADLLAQDDPRSVIDTLRYGVEYRSAEAFRRAKRAQQLDSTYYVGYQLEGFHYFARAEEQSGLARATVPMEKAADLFEREFGALLRQRITREDLFRGAGEDLFRQFDYLDLMTRLINCYISIEQPERAYATIQRLKRHGMALDFESYHWLAWLFFRSRIYTNEQYGFLEDTIEGNLDRALSYIDSLEAKHRRDAPYIERDILSIVIPNSPFANYVQAAFLDAPRHVVANTRGILYGYNFNPTLAARYFQKMDNDDSVAKFVNLGYTYHSDIDFRKAEEYFRQVPDNDTKSRGGHWQGFSTVYVYKGAPLEGALTLREKRDAHGFTIGYGWDNLCLARMYLYAGQLDESERSLKKAEEFNEVHYNSSFREDQYRFMARVIRMQESDYRMRAQRFENRNRWLTLDWWTSLPELSWTKYSTLYQLANELALNRERDIVYYHIFHTENIISFDELWQILRHYNGDFFQETFRRLQESDPRGNLRRYYTYMQGRLLQEDGDDEAAYDRLTAILRDDRLDHQYEKLLIARIHEVCGIIADDNGWTPQRIFHQNEMYRVYPELMPFSELPMAFALQVAPELRDSDDPHLAATLDQFRDCRIDLLDPDNRDYPTLSLSVEEGRIRYEVRQAREVAAQGFVDPTAPDAGKRLAYRLFRVMR